ncbi:MAG TPA: hydantoinase/oxoprolinase family protein, partial [Blastocatellia bacterium]|nr:hydantoinase/oxoprolinase family protein [Blastocatellia bacterium]
MGRRRIRIGLDVGVAHIRIVAVDGDTTEVVSVCTLATGTSPLKPLEMSARLRQFAQRSEGRESPTEGAGRDDLTERLHTALQQSAGSGSFAAQDVETVVLGTTWGTYPIGQSESPAVGLVIVGAPWSLERFTAPSSDSFSNPIRLLSLRLDPEQVGHEAVLRNTLYDLRSRGARVLVVADEAATSRREREVVAASVALGMPALALHDLAACQPAGGNDQAQNLLLRSLLIAGFLPRLVRLVELVEKSLRRCDITAPLLIMGNDAGVLRPDEFLRQPASALFSGHVASIIGTLIEEGSGASTEENAVILHIGGASTTVAPVRRGELITG